MADNDKRFFQVYDPETGSHTTKELTPKKFLAEYHEFQNDITKFVIVNGNTSTEKFSKKEITSYVDEMPDDKALELANILSNGGLKGKETALHGFLSSVKGNKQETIKEEKKETGWLASMAALVDSFIGKPEDKKVAMPTDHKGELKELFTAEFNNLTDGKKTFSYQVNLSDNKGSKFVDNMPVDNIKNHAEKYIENLSTEKAEVLAKQMQGNKSERAAATTEIISAANESWKNSSKEPPTNKNTDVGDKDNKASLNEQTPKSEPISPAQKSEQTQALDSKSKHPEKPAATDTQEKAVASDNEFETHSNGNPREISRGDTLSKIAQTEVIKVLGQGSITQENLNKMMNAYIEVNKEKLANPHLIITGEFLNVPNPAQFKEAPTTPIAPQKRAAAPTP